MNKNIRFKDFIRMSNVGNYVIAYAILEDRAYLSFAIENEIFECIRTFKAIYEEYKRETGKTYFPGALRLFKEKYLSRELIREFLPNEQQKEYIIGLSPMDEDMRFERQRPLSDFKPDSLFVEHVEGGSVLLGETIDNELERYGYLGKFTDNPHIREEKEIRGKQFLIKKASNI